MDASIDRSFNRWLKEAMAERFRDRGNAIVIAEVSVQVTRDRQLPQRSTQTIPTTMGGPYTKRAITWLRSSGNRISRGVGDLSLVGL